MSRAEPAKVERKKAWGELKWGDVEESLGGEKEDKKEKEKERDSKDKNETKVEAKGKPETKTTKTNADGLKTITEVYTNDKGQKVRVVRTVKVIKKTIRVNKNVAERRQWKKFGDCANVPPGPEENITNSSAELIKFELRPRKRDAVNKEETVLERLLPQGSMVVCRNCGATGHWTLKCPKPIIKGGVQPSSADLPAGPGGDQPKYVIPRNRAGASGAGSRDDSRDEATLRVTNLSEYTTEADLSDLFRRFGPMSRIYLAKDRLTQRSRCFAFINYRERVHAQAAIDKLDGHGYDNLILQVEWAKPREEKTRPAERSGSSGGAPGGPSGSRSGFSRLGRRPTGAR